MDGDRRSIAMAEDGRNDGNRRIQLMKRSLKQYQSLFIDMDDVARENAVINTFRKTPLTGVLTLTITAVRNVDHIASPLFSRNPESFVVIKIDDIEKARTKSSRNDRWAETFDISMEKANEVSIQVYDKNGNQSIPVGLAWLPLSDVAEEIRRKKVNQERDASNNWISASNMGKMSNHAAMGANQLTPPGTSSSSGHHSHTSSNEEFTDETSETSKAGPIICTDWYELEPNGQILISLGFVKSTEHRIGDGHVFGDGLGRHGAIRQRKEDVIEHHGHKFVQKQFYNIMCCAVCGDFLRYTGYQCEDCRFLCHKKCYKNVINKCISKSSTDTEPEETQLNHRIPHRFEQVSNRGTKWCCHCGYILPWGKKNVRKCSECGIMCHANCSHLVPDFCGMPIEKVAEILNTIRTAQEHKRLLQEKTKQRHQKGKLSTDSGSTLAPSKEASPHKKYNSDPFNYGGEQQLSPTGPTGQVPPPPANYPNGPVSQQYLEHQQDSLPLTPAERLAQQQQQQQPQIHLSPERESKPAPLPKEDYQYSHNVLEASPEHQVNLAPSKNSISSASSTGQPIPAQYDQLQQQQLLEQQRKKAQQLLPQQHQQQQQQQQQLAQAQQQQQQQQQQQLVQQTQQQQQQISHQHTPSGHHGHRHGQKKSHRKRRYGLDDFNFLSVLGKGNFGKVMLAESIHTKKLCAIKVLKKDFIIQNDEVESTKSEKRVFLIANKGNHPFLLNLHQCFQTENRIYFVMEYISGGDLMWHVQRRRFSLRRAQFYAAEVLLALKFLHENGVVYRDLKLDNILLTVEGHIKLADYGLCKENMWYGNKTSTFCGTPELMAPEILREQGYDKAVDWWAFGVLLYQMLLTKSPFKGDDEDEVFNAILTDDPLYPINMAREAVDILQRLLTREVSERLGSGDRDAYEIMEHPYFKNINFDDILHCRVPPPFVPEVKDPRDPSCFDEEFTSQAARLTPVNSVLSTNMQEQFRGFTYVNEDEPI
ncbi:unnamed protein product [Ambrosiozyma monospora]|uniref:Unnamed protein product n=1 Tax=Ambrosiozyma monospora TaxID=43982 RepID=A0ACB5SUS8_AMBMO|nr:unnamed protein product [Ambrosiozyma monospora]